jgi:hypothetical protein
MKIIPFHHFVLFTRGHPFPAVKSRSHLVRLFQNGIASHDLDDAEANANLLWNEYITWHCLIAPVDRTETFKTWTRRLRQFDNEHERAFAQDVDMDFPRVFNFDFIVDYLTGLGALDEAIDAFERLWIKYNSED